MTQWKDVGRMGRRVGAVRRGIGPVIETLERRALLASTPLVDWSSYLGGSNGEWGLAIAPDAHGNAWATGFTDSSDLASGGFDTTYNGARDGFVAKVRTDGTLAWSSYLGGSGEDRATGIAVDGHGNAWIVGITNSTDLASNGFDSTYNGGAYDDFVAKINADGTLAWVSYLGGSGEEGEITHIAIDANGDAWVTGDTASTDLASGGFDTTYNGGNSDGFVAKINANGTLAWSSYLGGDGQELMDGIATDASGNAWVTGWTESTNFAIGGFDTTYDGYREALVAKINANGTLAWSSYLYLGGPNGGDMGSAIAIDGDGNAWVTGVCSSVARINGDGTLAWSTYRKDMINYYGIAIDHTGNAWVAGFDLVNNQGALDAIVARISPDGTRTWLRYLPEPHRTSTFADGPDTGFGIAVDGSDNVWVTGQTYRNDFASGGFDTTLDGFTDAFIVRITQTPNALHAPVAYDQSLTTSMNIPINGTMIASDPDRDPLTYAVMTQPTHGNISFTAAGAFTYTPEGNYDGSDSFTYKANDGTYDSNIATISITITRELQANVSLSPSSILENQPVGTFIGNLSVSGPDATPPFTYSLIPGDGDDNNASFSVSGDQLFSAAVFDFETRSSYSIRVRATDSLNHFFEQAFTITVMNVNEAPTDLTLTNTAIPELQPPGLHIGQLFTVDPDIGDTFTYTLIDGDGSDDNASFAITGNQLLTADSFDLAGRDTYSIRIRSTDAGGLSFEKAFTLHVIDTVLSSACVPENRPSGTLVGTLSCTNPDYSPSMSYELVQGDGDTDNASFIIAGNQLCTATPFNYEWKNSYSIRIRTNGSGVSYENSFVISILNVNESPTNVLLSGKGIPEDQPIGTTVGRLSATDSDGQDSFTYILVPGQGDDDNASFTIRGDRLVTAVTFDYVPWRDYSVRIRATDAGGLSVEQNVWKPGMAVFEYGLVDGRVHKTYKAADTDGDVATFNLTGGGLGSFWDNQIGLLNTTRSSVLSISVKRGKTGDGLFPIGDIVSDGLLKSINAKGIILTGQVLLDTLDKSATNKAALSMTLAQLNGAEILPQNLPLSSITVSGDVSNTRILTSGSLGKFTAASLHDSQILLGISPDFDGLCATSPTDFIHPSARLGSLLISGRKLPQSQPAPAYVTSSHISAPAIGSVTLMNVPLNSGPIVHMLNDIGTLKLTHSKLTTDPMLSPGTWKLSGTHPPIWQVIPATAG